MDRAYKILPVFSGDVSGACSALYELGGMVVLHDPSGCNSTYNTHDEVRWNRKESLIFLSGLTDIDAITGNDEKIIDDICKGAESYKPKFIAIANSPIPYVNGTDFEFISKEVKKRTGIETFAVYTNAFHDYTIGASKALVRFCEKMIFPANDNDDNKQNENSGIKINILGITPLDYPQKDAPEKMIDFFEGKGFEVNSNWTYDSSFENVSKVLMGDVNVVVSSIGMDLARLMEEKYGIPYVVGSPEGKFGDVLALKIKEAFETKKSIVAYLEPETQQEIITDEKYTVICETVLAGSMAAALRLEGKDARAVAATEIYEGLIGPKDEVGLSEEKVISIMEESDVIVADPMYKLALKKDVKFIERPHFAFSGRMHL